MGTKCTLSDITLTEQLKLGSHLAYTEIYERYFGILYVHACKRMYNHEDARDLVQETFFNLWTRREHLIPEKGVAPYLYRSVRNGLIDLMSKQSICSKYITSLSELSKCSVSITDYPIREHQLAAIIEKEIDALSPRMREVFILSRKQYLSHKEIAEQLHTSELTVKTQIKQALRILRGKLSLIAYLAVLFRIY
ncbi:RNA polymerase sigma-70 factor, Bacteroides expansion family 1 [Pedobacter steynii]|uniref:RNA polymerase sigma-70 factor, Bacteroides expansion family 1 n=1 Tax=Pedobacter steynii TaxID=430522 RepID=A0A1G9PCK8_9SPHI|nr:RNA polymerase sigma-70 factor [Pedobacter steynii]NQX39029.1 RNA polymerase sigma-70 factor [Pedobacter steynii]SDL96293.1 RNA polymerase sigma-70 factor, Bacteroides expansion family 1 [Pedobacter steynii]